MKRLRKWVPVFKRSKRGRNGKPAGGEAGRGWRGARRPAAAAAPAGKKMKGKAAALVDLPDERDFFLFPFLKNSIIL